VGVPPSGRGGVRGSDAGIAPARGGLRRTRMRAGTKREHGSVALTSWRRDQLLEAGFPRALAARVARDRTWDLHALIELAERGCPPELAVRILAPIDGG
jgi:hypothetical protein